MNTLKEAMPGEDAGRIRGLIAELQQAMMGLGQAMHSGSGETQSGGSRREDENDHTKPHPEDVVEGDFRTI
jgi:hypothetical protein